MTTDTCLNTAIVPAWENSPQETQDSQELKETQILKKPRYRETQETHEPQEKPLASRVATMQEAVSLSLSSPCEDFLFKFARALKAFEQTMGVKLDDKGKEEAFAEWWRTGGQTSLPSGSDFYTEQDKFFTACRKAKSPLGSNPLETAMERAKTLPLPQVCQQFPGEAHRALLAVCWHLWEISGHTEFFISYRDGAKITGKDKNTAASILEGFCRRRVLELIQLGTNEGGYKASRYRFTKGTPTV